MNAYITEEFDLIVTKSTARTSIEQGKMDRIRVPWFRLSKAGALYQLEEFGGEEIRIVAKAGVAHKLLVPLVRKGGEITVESALVVKEWLDIQAGLSR